MQKLASYDDQYPSLLKQIPDFPPHLYAEGSYDPRDFELGVAIVGTRTCTDYGRSVARHFARELAKRKITIISGLARGIDREAHEGALEVGGRTVAVLGNGLDSVYPQEHAKLARAICAHGALLSELEPEEGPRPFHFPRRNRIVAGLSKAIVVVEAPLKSGALITARLAAEYNRDVFCVPGSVFSRASEGVHAFIRDGAHPVFTPEDVLVALGITPEPEPLQEQVGVSLGGEAQAIYVLLHEHREPLLIDEIIKASNIAATTVNVVLAELELKGFIRHMGRGKYTTL